MKRNKLLYFFIILFPFIDLITAIEARKGIFLTLGLLVKGLFFLYIIYYVIFLSTSKHRKFSLYYFFSMLIFLGLYFGFKMELLNFKFLLNEGNNLFKLLYLPVVFVFLINYFDEYGFNKKLFIKTNIIVLLEYTILMLIPLCLNAAYKSYGASLSGFVGWFYSANEMSMIMVLLLPFIYFLYDKKYNFLISLPVVFVLSYIGTKGVLLGSMVIFVMAFIYLLIYFKGKFNTYVVGSLFTLIFGVFFMFFINNITTQNTQMMAEYKDYSFEIEDIKDIDEEVSGLLSFLLNGRDNFFVYNKKIYIDSFGFDYLLTGMGYSNTNRVSNHLIFKIVEIDFIDMFFRTGILSIIIVILPFIYTFLLVIKYLFKKSKNYQNTILVFMFSTVVCLVMGASLIQGHVINFPSVSIYLILNLVFILYFINYFEDKKLNYKKVSILALHMGVGGIENVICNQANALSKNYDVEILSLYKNDKIYYDLDKKVKVKYLMKMISNRKDLIISMKGLNDKSFFKEFFKAIYILVNKKRLIRKEIVYSKSGVIISTRKEFSKILGKYANDNVITISEEHNHHNNQKKYINDVIKSCKNIDYLLPSSLELTRFYTNRVDSKCAYIPNALNFIPDKINKFDNDKIVVIGRLVKEKNYQNLIEVMKSVCDKNKKITLDIYGDGPEKEMLLKKINEYHLENNVFLKGLIHPGEVKNILPNYSLCVCTSLHESFGISLLEAMSFGIPVICYDDTKGPLEFVNNENGVIVSRNTVDMAKNIVNLLSNKKLLKEKGSKARIKAMEYSFDNVSLKLNNLIDNLILNEKRLHTKVLFVSSMGGHLNELLQLDKLFDNYKYMVVTEKTNINVELEKKYRMKFLASGNKHKLGKYIFWIVPVNLIKSLYYIIKFKPDAIISTGAHSAVPVFIFGKLKGSKLIYIETFANLSSKTLTGRILYPLVDVFAVQWKSMLKFYPNAVYWGWLF